MLCFPYRDFAYSANRATLHLGSIFQPTRLMFGLFISTPNRTEFGSGSGPTAHGPRPMHAQTATPSAQHPQTREPSITLELCSPSALKAKIRQKAEHELPWRQTTLNAGRHIPRPLLPPPTLHPVVDGPGQRCLGHQVPAVNGPRPLPQHGVPHWAQER